MPSDQVDGELAFGALEAGSDDPDEVGREQNARQDNQRGGEREDGAHGTGDAARLLLIALSEEAGIHRDEGGREHSFAEQVLQEVGDFEGGVESVGFVLLAEVVGEDALPHQAHDAADQNSGGDEEGVAAGALPFFHGGH